MNEKEIAEINMYCDPYSILVVTNKRRLVRLKCPFQVQFTQDIDQHKTGDIAYVDRVIISDDLQLIYIVKKVGYHYTYCKITFIDK
jgi:hypothetical protein